MHASRAYEISSKAQREKDEKEKQDLNAQVDILTKTSEFKDLLNKIEDRAKNGFWNLNVDNADWKKIDNSPDAAVVREALKILGYKTIMGDFKYDLYINWR